MLYYQDVKNIVKVYAIQVLCLQWQGGANTPPKPIPTRRTAPGLIDAIPVFLNTCAITYRLAHDNENESITVKSMWYELLLDLLTQATIECYLCDSYNSIDALLEIFSYGDIDPSDYHSIIQKVMTMMILTLLLLVLAIMAMYNIFGWNFAKRKRREWKRYVIIFCALKR